MKPAKNMSWSYFALNQKEKKSPFVCVCVFLRLQYEKGEHNSIFDLNLCLHNHIMYRLYYYNKVKMLFNH